MAEIPLGKSRYTEQKAKVILMALTAKRMIRVLAFVLLAVFGFLKLKGVPLGSAIDSLPAELVFKIALIAYFFSWVLGTINDANEQEVIYAVPAEGGRFPWQGYAVGGVLAFVFGVMCYVRNPRHFILALTFFLVVNVLAWRYLLRKLLPEAYAGSRRLYRREKDVGSLFRLEVFYRYIAGKWQWYRFGYGALLLIPLYFLAFSTAAEGVAATLGLASKDTLVALSFLIYVLSFEAWIWLERMKIKFVLGVFEDFSSEFKLVAVSADVLAAYDRIAEAWSESRRQGAARGFRERELLDRLVAPLAAGSRVLDVGCGCGEPIAAYLVGLGFRVTGLDGSVRMVELARRSVPEAAFLSGDMRAAEPGGPFDALVAWDSVFHLPPAEHAAVFVRLHSWLRPGGRLLLSLGGRGGELTSEMLGETFFYGGHPPEEALRLLEAAGFAIEHWEVDDPSSEGHISVLAVSTPTPRDG